MKHFRFSENSKYNMRGVNQKLIDLAYEALAISPIDFGIPMNGGLRTIAAQRRLFEKGLSKCDGDDRVSKHQLGAALDVAPWVDGPSNDPEHYAIVAAAFLVAAQRQGVNLWWGGLWPNFKDMPHLQLDASEYE